MNIFQSKRFFVFFSVLLLAAKMWLVNAHSLMATTTPHDDLLFIRQAFSILSGEWLGEYNQYTLIKGQFYPLFIAGCYYLNIPVLAAQQLLYAFASFVAIWAVRPLIKPKWLLPLLFAFLLLNPFSYNYPAVGRAFRLGIYAPLGLLVISCITGLYVRSRHSWKNCIIWSAGAGIFLSAFCNTREESIWLAPSLLLLLIPAFFSLRRLPRSHALILAGLYLLPLLMMQGTNYTLKKINQRHYGVFATIEVESPEFKSAYGGLLRIKSDKWRQYFPVVTDVYEQAYEVSPTFREVKPYFSTGRGDIPAALFIWAFRDTVAAAGYHHDGSRTLQFYKKMGNEIHQACEDGKLDCRPKIFSLVPPWHKEYNSLLLPTWFSVLKRMVDFSDFSADTKRMVSRGSRKTMFLYDLVSHDKLLTSRPDVLIRTSVYQQQLNREKVRILNDIGAGYQKITPLLFIPALAMFLFMAGRSVVNRKLSVLTVAGSACLTGLLSISFILSMLAITSYSEIERAMHSAYPMVLFFIIVVILDVVTSYRPGRKNKDKSSMSESK